MQHFGLHYLTGQGAGEVISKSIQYSDSWSTAITGRTACTLLMAGNGATRAHYFDRAAEGEDEPVYHAGEGLLSIVAMARRAGAMRHGSLYIK